MTAASSPSRPSPQERPELARPSYWTDERKALLEWFRGKTPSLASTYEGAVEILFAAGFPARVHFVSHAAREIGNRLPEAYASVRRLKPFQYRNKIDAISRDWPDALFDENDASSEAHAPPTDPRMPIPRQVVAMVDELIREHRLHAAQGTAASQVFKVLSASGEAEAQMMEPMIRRFQKLLQWFVKYAHVPAYPAALPDHTELQEQFERFENTIWGLTRALFPTFDELDDILRDTNPRSD